MMMLRAGEPRCSRPTRSRRGDVAALMTGRKLRSFAALQRTAGLRGTIHATLTEGS
jgi:hypothetical protein